MIVKLPYLRLPRRIFARVHFNAYVSSISRANCIQIIPQSDENPPNSSEFEAKIQSLKNKLHPETLIHVLSSTSDLNSSLKLFKWASLQNRFRHTADTYYQMIMKLGMASIVDEMEGLCNEMVKGGFAESEQALLGLLDSFIGFRKLDEALRVLFVLNSFGFKPSIALINRLLGVLVEEKKGFQLVLFVYKEMVKASVIPTIETLNYLLEALFDANRVDSVLNQYKRMQKKGCCPNSRTYEILISGLVGKNLLDESLVVLNEILESGCDLELELKFFSHILPLLFRINKPEMGLKLFEKMKSSKVVPDSSIYETLIQYFSKNLCMDDALNLLNEMKNLDLEPPDCVFVDLVNGFCMLNKFGDAKKFLEDQEVIEANLYNPLLNGYCQAGNFVDAIVLFQKMVENDITDSLSWNIIIRYLSENGGNNIVYRVLGKMIVSGYTPDSFTYSVLIIGKCKSSELNDALKMFNHVSKKSWVVDSSSYAILIENLCKMDKSQEAADVFRYMSINKHPLHASSFTTLISGLCGIGNINKVIKLLPLAYYSGLSCSNEDYSIIIKGLCKSSKGNGVLVIVARMVVEGCRLDSEAYNEIIKSMSEHHRAKECALFLNLMINKGLLPDLDILANVLSFLAQNLSLHLVLPVIKSLFSGHEVINISINPVIYNKLINGLWKEGYEHEARWLLDLMLEKGWVPDANTHRLLINYGANEESAYEKGITQDEIISILSEGFGEQ